MNKKINCINHKDILPQKVSQTLRYVKSIQPILYLYYENSFFDMSKLHPALLPEKSRVEEVESVLDYKSIYNR